MNLEIIFGIDINNIFFVGSSQLGFSITPSGKKYKFKEFREFEIDGEEESDIDVAIISAEIFEEELKKLYNYLGAYHIKFINEKFYGIERGSDKKQSNVYFQDFSTYLLKGWLRSDKMPLNYKFFNDDIRNLLTCETISIWIIGICHSIIRFRICDQFLERMINIFFFCTY